MSGFVRVSRREPCPICGKPDWCEVTADGRAALCMRVESEKSTRNGGWWHWLSEVPRDRVPVARPAREEKLDPGELERMLTRWGRKTSEEMLGALAAHLGVAEASLDDLGAVYADIHSAWAFPMRRFNGEVAGIRLRAATGKKWAVPGSRDGLFVPVMERGEIGTLFVCEGPTDTAAALSIGLCAIGRPSCRGARVQVKLLAHAWKVRRVCVIADADKPGQEGGIELCRRIGLPSAMIVPPAKDVREWVKQGGMGEEVDDLVEQTEWRWRWESQRR